MRISDWSSDVCSSDLTNLIVPHPRIRGQRAAMTAISLSQRLDEYFVPLLAKLSGLMRSRRRWRVPLLLIAGLIFLVGAYWAFSTLPISPGQLRTTPLLILAGLIVPSLLYGGVGLWLLARSARLLLPVRKATLISRSEE